MADRRDAAVDEPETLERFLRLCDVQTEDFDPELIDRKKARDLIGRFWGLLTDVERAGVPLPEGLIQKLRQDARAIFNPSLAVDRMLREAAKLRAENREFILRLHAPPDRDIEVPLKPR